jgi:prepilin-type processing-associated H-X9-DG protein
MTSAWNAQYCAGQGWAGQVYPYVKSSNVFTCPDDTTNLQNGYPVALSYAYNLNAATYNSGMGCAISKFSSVAVTVNLAEVTGNSCRIDYCYQPTNAALSATGNGYSLSSTPNGCWNGVVHYVTGYMQGIGANTGAGCSAAQGNTGPSGIHSNGSNYLLMDGHIKWLLGANVSPGWDAPSPAAPASVASSTASGTQNTGAQITFSKI